MHPTQLVPSSVTTVLPTSSLSRIAGPRDLVDDHVARPSFGAVAVEVVPIGVDLDRRFDLRTRAKSMREGLRSVAQ